MRPATAPVAAIAPSGPGKWKRGATRWERMWWLRKSCQAAEPAQAAAAPRKPDSAAMPARRGSQAPMAHAAKAGHHQGKM